MKRLMPTDEMYFKIANKGFYKVEEVFQIESGYISQQTDEQGEMVYQIHDNEGRNFNVGLQTFEMAVVTLLTQVYDGLNSKADEYFRKMINYK